MMAPLIFIRNSSFSGSSDVRRSRVAWETVLWKTAKFSSRTIRIARFHFIGCLCKWFAYLSRQAISALIVIRNISKRSFPDLCTFAFAMQLKTAKWKQLSKRAQPIGLKSTHITVVSPIVASVNAILRNSSRRHVSLLRWCQSRVLALPFWRELTDDDVMAWAQRRGCMGRVGLSGSKNPQETSHERIRVFLWSNAAARQIIA